MKALLCILFIFIPFLIKAKPDSDSVLVRIRELNRLCEQADTTRRTWEEGEILDSILSQISDDISILLQNPAVSCTRLENSIGAFIQTVKSEDTLIWVFEWDEKSGGSYRSCSKIMCYYDVSGERKIVTGNNGEEDKGYLIYDGLWTGGIYKLKSEKQIYLINEGAQTCNTCIADYYSTGELTDSGLIAYPGFYGESIYDETADDYKTSSYGIEYRWNESNGLVFDPEKQIIISSYFEDDLSGYNGDPESARYLTDTLIFDGEMFLNSTQKYFLQLISLTIKYDSINYEDENINSDSLDWLNFDIESTLEDLVMSPQFNSSTIEDLKSIGPWYVINSDDERLVMISWQSDPNASPQFSTEKNMFFFWDEKLRYHLFWDEDKDFPSESSDYEAFYHLKSDPSIYILSSNELGCIYCENTGYAQVIQIVNDSLNLNYPAFENQSEIYNNPGYAAIAYGFDFDEDSDELFYHIVIEDSNQKRRENVKIYKFENGKFTDISEDPIRNKIEELKKIMGEASSIKPKVKNKDLIDSLNIMIYNRLYYLLSQPEIVRYDLDDSIKNNFFSIKHANDGMLHVYSWQVNKKTDKEAHFNFMQSYNYPYIHANHIISHVSGYEITPEDSLENFYSYIFCDSLILLAGDGDYNEYLLIGYENNGKDIIRKFATVYATDDLEIYPVAAFQNEYEIMVTIHPENLLKFEYDSKQQLLIMTYVEDELTGFSVDKNHPRQITKTWRFKGGQFEVVTE